MLLCSLLYPSKLSLLLFECVARMYYSCSFAERIWDLISVERERDV
uniref:Uncharacterized protein n=1 Tax=Anguilla anguilla TaxID=7936 RepID=A0A0E9XJX3_ANGAN